MSWLSWMPWACLPRFHEVPESYIEDRVQDGARSPAHVWRQTFNGLCNAALPTDSATITCPALNVWGDRDVLSSGGSSKVAVPVVH